MRRTAADRAREWIMGCLMDGTLAPGSFIDEAAVCAAAGVSRTPTREAFHRLEGQGFIARVPRRGFQVRHQRARDLFAAFDARLMVEMHAVTVYCAERLSVPAEMRSCLRLLDELDDYDTDATLAAHVAADRSFHAALVHTLDNAAVDHFFDGLWELNQWGFLRRAKRFRTEEFLVKNREEHHAIVDGLERHDAASVHSALRDHLWHRGADARFFAPD